MTQTLPLPETGVSKRAIIEMAYEECGMSGAEFGETPEEMTRALRRLNIMMMQWPWSALGYDQPVNGGLGELGDLSNIPGYATGAVVSWLATVLAPGMGKTLAPEQRNIATAGYHEVAARVSVIPEMTMPAGALAGAGSRSPFFTGPLADDETDSNSVDLVSIAESV